MNIEQLRKKLDRYPAQIDYSRWGQDGSRSIEDLLHEIKTRKSQLRPKDGVLYRDISAAMVHVFCHVGPAWYHLIEFERIMSGGIVRRYTRVRGITGKLRPRQTMESAAREALEREVGMPAIAALYPVDSNREENWESRSFPTLPTRREHGHFACLWQPRKFERQDIRYLRPDGATSVFAWREVIDTLIPAPVMAEKVALTGPVISSLARSIVPRTQTSA